MPTRKRAAAKAAPAPEVTDDAFEELEELEDVEDVEEAPAAKPTRKAAAGTAKKAAAADAPKFDSNWLAEHVTETTGVSTDARSLRMLLRKMAAAGELERVVGEDRGRYSFKGVNDPLVKLVVRKVKAGDLAATKREGLEKVQATAASKKAAPAEKAPAKKAAATKAAPAKAAPSRRRRTAAAE